MTANTRLTTAQIDRAAGVLLASACGDALGVPYEFGTPPAAGELAQMLGGGLGDFAPAEWSDDTSMAIAIADVAATGADLRTEAALDAIGEGFLRWYASGPADIGIQTSAVLSASARRWVAGESGVAAILRDEAVAYAASHPLSAGNGALMRTGPVALAHLHDRVACTHAARAIAELTHADPLAGDSCVLWSEAIRVAVLDAVIDVEAGLDLILASRRELWRGWLAEATRGPASAHTPNGFTVTALQAAMSSIVNTSTPADVPSKQSFRCLHLQDSLHAAIRIGNDTDTVAAIAGALLGARWGASAVPWRWRRIVHGWPGLAGRDLVALATVAVGAEWRGWPVADELRYEIEADPVVVPHPSDARVLLGTHASRGHGASAVVSLCRVGPHQPCFDGAQVIVESRLVDSDWPAENPNLHFAIFDAADAVRGLRQDGHKVFVHCVAAQQRTPAIAVAYGLLLGDDEETLRRGILAALTTAEGRGLLWRAAGGSRQTK